MPYVVFLVSLTLLKRTCVREKYGLPNFAWQRMLRQSGIQFIHWLLLPSHSQPSVSHLGLWVLSVEERGLNTAWISHFPSSQWPVHNPLETRQGKLTQKSSCQGREESVPFIFRPREKLGHWHLSRFRIQCKHQLPRNSFSCPPPS